MTNEPRARLIGLSGPTGGRLFDLESDVTTVGRDPANTIVVDAHWVSREHCEIVRGEEGYVVRDRGSHNGTSVNGVPTNERQLANGDRITLAGASFLFSDGSSIEEAFDNESETRVTIADTPIVRTTTQLSPTRALYLNPDRLSTEPLDAEELGTALSAFLRMVQLDSDQDDLDKGVLDVFFDVIPAERGAIVMGEEPHSLDTLIVRDQRKKSASALSVSRTVLSAVFDTGAALLSNRPFEDEVTGEAESILRARVACLVCLPLCLSNGSKPIGAVYLDSTDPSTAFPNPKLEVLMGLARIASRALHYAREVGRFREEAARMRDELKLTHDMIGESRPLRKAQETLAKVAPADTTVLIMGESGTGKELAARAVHFNSPRRERAFIKVDCTGLNESLLGSDLFGHERGAFTGAIQQKKGKFEVAHGGTVFLDEVGELPLSLQAQLLRVLQDGEIERVGGTRPIRVDVRVVAATNRNLAEEVKAERFRDDLYYRLNVVTVTLPPLRARGRDKVLLARYFASEFSRKVKRKVVGFADDALAAIERYEWPGNVRELANAVERAVVLGSTDRILREDLPELLSDVPLGTAGGPGKSASFHESVSEHKKQIIREALDQAGGTITEAANALGLHPNYLHRLISNLGLRKEQAT